MKKDVRYVGVVSLNDIITKAFKQKKINEEKDSPIQQIDETSLLKFLPKFEFSEKVSQLDGKSDNERRIFEFFISQKISSAPSLKDKISIISKFTQSPPEKISADEALGNLIILKSIRTLIQNYSAQSAGNIGQHYLAALFGGKRNQKEDVIDITIGDEGYQVKIYSSDAKEIDISAATYQSFFAKSKKNLNFLYVVKQGKPATSLDFYSFSISKDDYEKYLTLDNPQQDKDNIEQSNLNEDTGETPNMFIKSKYGKTQKHVLNADYFLKNTQNFLGKIQVSDEMFNSYTNVLRGSMTEALVGVANLINNVSVFFASGNEVSAHQGIKNCNQVAGAITKKMSEKK